MRWRYKADNLPVRGVGAFAPTQAMLAASSSWGEVVRAGAPGTMPIYSPAPAALPVPSNNPRTAGSNNSPDVIRPALYVTTPDNMGPDVPVRPPNMLPMPAVDFHRVPRNALKPPPRLGGRKVIPWPRSFQRWGSETSQPAS